jgi:LEA14-like dessication related protein
MSEKSKKGSIALVVSLIGIGLLIIGGVSIYFLSQYQKIKDFCVKFMKSNTKINSLGISKTDITLFFQLLNKSSVKATVDGYEFKIYVNDNYISTAYSKEMIFINPKSFSTVEVNVLFNPLQVLQIGLGNIGDIIANNREKIKIKVDGKLLGVKSVIKVNEIPISYDTNLKELTSDSTEDEATECA